MQPWFTSYLLMVVVKKKNKSGKLFLFHGSNVFCRDVLLYSALMRIKKTNCCKSVLLLYILHDASGMILGPMCKPLGQTFSFQEEGKLPKTGTNTPYIQTFILHISE